MGDLHFFQFGFVVSTFIIIIQFSPFFIKHFYHFFFKRGKIHNCLIFLCTNANAMFALWA